MEVTKHQFFHDGGPYDIETSPLICSVNQWPGFYRIETSFMKELRLSSPIILRKSFLVCCKAEFVFFLFFFLSVIFFKNIHDSEDSREKRRLSLYVLSTTSTRFTIRH